MPEAKRVSMQADDLKYENLVKIIAPLLVKGKTESLLFSIGSWKVYIG
jgi:hypothetical protein